MASNNSNNVIAPREPFKIARFTSTLGQTIVDSSSSQVDIQYNNVEFIDTHVIQASATSFQIQEAGLYEVVVLSRLSQPPFPVNAGFEAYGIAYNGSTVAQKQGFVDVGSPTTGTVSTSFSQTVVYKRRMAVGDTIVHWVRNDNTSNIDRSMNPSAVYNNITITKMGE